MLLLDLTSADLRDGRVIDADDCPLCRAFNRALAGLPPPRPVRGYVFAEVIAIDYGGARGIVEVPMPRWLIRLVDRLDSGDTVRPRRIAVEIPDP